MDILNEKVCTNGVRNQRVYSSSLSLSLLSERGIGERDRWFGRRMEKLAKKIGTK